MKKKILCTILGLTLTLGMGITSMAAPVAVEGGGVFDAEYYAQNNADVVAEAGTDFNALWQHFTLFGVNEGRLPFAIGTDWEYIQANGPFQSLSNSQTVSTTTATTTTTTEDVATEDTTTTTTTTSTDVSTAVTEYAQAGVAYPITLIMDGYYDEEGNYAEGYKVNNTTLAYFDGVNKFAKAVNGYEWKVGVIQFAETDINYSGDWWYRVNLEGSTNWVKDDSDDADQYFPNFDYIANDIMATHKYDLTGADGSVKTGYVIYLTEYDYDNAVEYPSFYYMVPTDFTGNVTLTIYGTKLENGEIVENENDSHTFIVK